MTNKSNVKSEKGFIYYKVGERVVWPDNTIIPGKIAFLDAEDLKNGNITVLKTMSLEEWKTILEARKE